MTAEQPHDTGPPEQPFPLKRLFRRRFVPALIGFTAVTLLLIGYTAGEVVRSVYLELAKRRAQTIARSVSSLTPAPWAQLESGRGLGEIAPAEAGLALAAALDREVRALALPEIKIYGRDRRVLYATRSDEIGNFENGEALQRVIANGSSAILTKNMADGTRRYELYVPVYGAGGQLRLVFELYEPVGYFDEILIEAAVPTVAIPGLMLLLLSLATNRLVIRAQADIDRRAAMVADLRRRVESFVSASAAEAARHASPVGDIRSRTILTTLLYSDVRDFTSYAERERPERVVGFLNELMTLQVDAVRAQGGDVDKMIGDAVLARFDGDDGGRRALAAARSILGRAAQHDFPRSLGIGLYRGQVIAGAIGPSDRRDFTVIGDAVNVAARLCSEAGPGEIVAEESLADADFGAAASIGVKGRAAPVSIRRWKA